MYVLLLAHSSRLPEMALSSNYWKSICFWAELQKLDSCISIKGLLKRFHSFRLMRSHFSLPSLLCVASLEWLKFALLTQNRWQWSIIILERGGQQKGFLPLLPLKNTLFQTSIFCPKLTFKTFKKSEYNFQFQFDGISMNLDFLSKTQVLLKTQFCREFNFFNWPKIIFRLFEN